MRGALISFEGIEGVGKTTQISRLISRLESAGLETVCSREPGGTALGERVRSIFKDSLSISSVSELFLLSASRAQLVQEIIEPALSRGAVVVVDRFIDSTVAYQGYGRGFDFDQIHRVNEWAIGGRYPDKTIYLRLDPRMARLRADQRRFEVGESVDRIEREGLEFFERVARGFDQIALRESYRVSSIDASKSIEEVEAQIWRAVTGTLGATVSEPSSVDAL